MRTVIIAFLAGSLPLLSYAHPNAPRNTAETVKLETKAEKTAEAEKAKPDGKEMPLCASPATSTWNPVVAGWMCKPTLWAGAATRDAG